MMEEAVSPEAKDAGAAAPQAGAMPDRGPRFTLGPSDSLEGKLTFQGSLRIEGRVVGELHLTGDIEVASSAVVTASLEASNVDVEGEVQGPVVAGKRLSIAGSGKLSGDVHVGRLRVTDGASLLGNVRMGGFE